MKFVGMKSGLAARKKRAAKLGHGGVTSDTTKMNAWLHRRVLQKLAENGSNTKHTL